MAFVTKDDILTLIRTTELSVIIQANYDNITEPLFAATGEVRSYLAHRYDTTKIFKAVSVWDATTTYAVYDIIKRYVSTAYAAATTYAADVYVSYEGVIYKSLQAANLGKTPDANPLWWSAICNNKGLYVCSAIPTAGTEVTNTSYWTEAGDYETIRQRIIDLTLYHLHANINPRNIPELRMNRRDEAISYLKAVQKGDVQLSLPLYTDTSTGGQITYGCNTKRKAHRY